jgi:hypothetical protein
MPANLVIAEFGEVQCPYQKKAEDNVSSSAIAMEPQGRFAERMANRLA